MISYQELNSIYPVYNILSSLGVKNLKERDEYFHFCSPFREDKNPSMALYKNNLFAVDFAGNYSASIFKLIKDLTNRDLYDYIGVAYEEFSSFVFNNTLKEENQKFFPEVSEEMEYEGRITDLEWNKEAYDYALFRNLNKEFLSFFKVQACKQLKINKGYFNYRLCIPIYEKGKLISWEGRDYLRNQKAKVLYPRGTKVSSLFNIDNLDRKKPLVIVEGTMDLAPIWQNFTKNVTHTYGIKITEQQKKLINEFEDVILFPDGDPGGRNMISSLEEFYENEFKVALIPDHDPGDAPLKEVEKQLNNPKTITQFLIDESGLFEEKERMDFFL